MDTISPTAPLGAPPGPSGPRRVSRARSLLRFSGYTDQAALLLWVVFTSSPTYGPAALVRYALVGYFMICLVLFAGQTMKGFLRGWPTLILPVLCFISAIWAPSVSDAMRLGVFMFLTAVIPVYAATRLSGKQILTCYFLGEIYGAVLSVLHPNIAGGNWTGVFGQKNFLAGHMFIMYATGLPLLLDPTTNKWLRLAAAAFVPLGAAIVF
ncbi:MAG TPA: hypothetical protein VG942_05085, partial [Hyphomonadaceae bacterium]|nr:hypothetical protein [Hyphomonadaceae bacterium]